jgi:hypothetical protein
VRRRDNNVIGGKIEGRKEIKGKFYDKMHGS